MSCIIKSVCRLCRREGQKLFLKGERCYTDKCAYERRPYPPGQHGRRRMKFSEFALQLREKQKVRRYYGVFEKTFRSTYKSSARMKGDTGLNFLRKLEMRLDSVVYYLGFSASRREAKQLISHNHVLLNGHRANVPSILCRPGDMVEVRAASKGSPKVLAAMKGGARREIPAWLEPCTEEFRGEVKALPDRDHVTVPVEENMIVEFYSR